MTEATAFSTSGEDAITRVIDIGANARAPSSDTNEFDEFFEIQQTAEAIRKGGYKRIALQFSDDLLPLSVPIYRKLKSRINSDSELYVLADTSYGSCCVDEVAAQHVDADALVHYGHACMSLVSRIPVVYVFGKQPIDVVHCVGSLVQEFRARRSAEQTHPTIISLQHEVGYTHQAENLLASLRKVLDPLEARVVYNPIQTTLRPASSNGEPTSEGSVEYNVLFYVGGESLGLTNLLLLNASCEAFVYDPISKRAQLESTRSNKLLARRYAVVQKARDSDIFAILVGTLGVASYLPIIRYLRSLLAKHRKKAYTITVGKLTPAKLANFLEIECFVLVACPENSLIDTKEFLRPIVTPFELEIALQANPIWTGKYVLDFDQILRGQHSCASNDDITDEDHDQPHFSLITGRYHQAKRFHSGKDVQVVDPGSSTVILRNQDQALSKIGDNGAAQFLQTRTFKGLEMHIGEDTPSVLEQGRIGIAKEYQDDH